MRHPLTTLWIGSIVALTSVARAPAQQSKESAAQRLERAVLVDESEHDAARAIELYTGVATDPAASKELRAKAWLRCGKTQKRLGKDDDAKKSFESAAALEGDAAEEAKRIVSGKDEETQRLRDQVVEKLGDLSHFANSLPSQTKLDEIRPFNELVWIGEPAVPLLELNATEKGPNRNPNLAALQTLALVEIGGERAAAALRRVVSDSDPLYQRAFVAWLALTSKMEKEPVRTELLGLLRQPDPRIRVLAIDRLQRVAKIEELVQLVRDPNEEVRVAAVDALGRLQRHASGGYSDVVVAALRDAASDSSKSVRAAVCTAFSDGTLLRNRPGRELFLDLLTRDDLFDGDERWAQNAVNSWSVGTLTSPPSATRLLEVARKLGPFHELTSGRSTTPRQWGLLAFVGKCCSTENGQSAPPERWSHAERPALWEMVRLGVVEVANWTQERASVEDAVGVAEAVADYGSATAFSGFLSVNASKLGEADRPRFVAAMIRLFDAIDLTMRRAPELQRSGELSRILEIVVQIGSDDGDRALLERAPKVKNPLFYADLLLRRSRPPKDAVLAGFLGLDVDHSADATSQATIRSRIVRRLARSGAPELLAQLPHAYELGLEPLDVASDEPTRRSNGPLGVRGVNELLFKFHKVVDDRTWAPIYDADATARVFEACAKSGTAAFWQDVAHGLSNLGSEPRDELRERLTAIVRDHMTAIPDSAQTIDGAKLRDVVLKSWLSNSGPQWEPFVVEHFDDPALQSAIVAAMPSIPAKVGDRLFELVPRLPDESLYNVMFACARSDDPKLREKTFDFLHHASTNVRSRALYVVFRHFRERALEAAASLATDPEWQVRRDLMSQLGETFDRRAIPPLIEALRDPNSMVRDEAKKSLEKIQFYVENKERWTKLLEGSGLEAGDAAAALLKQAAATQPKATRVAAIESLGTLGVAETLPMLIQFMGDADGDVAKAAKAAVDRVNRRAAEKESARKETPTERSSDH
jgi:HEAT repeat protein